MSLQQVRSTLFNPKHAAESLYGLILLVGGIFSWYRFGSYMDIYETIFLVGFLLIFFAIGVVWRSFCWLLYASLALGLLATYFYAGDIGRAETQFILKYALSSQSSLMWMSALFAMSLICYWLALFARSDFIGEFATALTWSGVTIGSSALLVRWYESYLKSPDIGHVPVSNLYEVVILFVLITTLLYLWYEYRYATRALGGFAMLLIASAIGFLLWYAYSRGAHEIQPLVPALQSYWMKIHVPANFVGYGGFTLAAMIATAWLIQSYGWLKDRLPAQHILEEMTYRAIAVGFAFFTVATILGALWAAEAWGTYWQWDPKETWAFIVWLNYAAWLHMRLIKGLRGHILAWWAVIGLLVTIFAFLGVNMFLSGLHSYGTL